MNKIRTAIEKAQDTVTDVGAKAMVTAANMAGRAMNTKLGRAASCGGFNVYPQCSRSR